jgi:Leucine-rich repeat (LRR) protein
MHCLPCRMALTSCCRELWLCKDIAASAALWADLEASFSVGLDNGGEPGSIAYILTDDEDDGEDASEDCGSAEQQDAAWQQVAARQLSLATWLARHGRGLRRLELHFGRGAPGDLAALLGSLRGSALAELHLCLPPGGQGRQCGGAASAGTSTGIDASLELLQHVTALTCLSLPWAGLHSLPPALSALSNLRDLDVSFNAALGRGGVAALRPLRHLAALSRLDLSECRLPRLPAALSTLSLLRCLNLRSAVLGRDSEAALPLQRLPQLTYLGLNNCSLARLPPALSALGGTLAELDLNWNVSLGWEGQGEASLAALAHLTALTCLGLARCSLRCLPRGLSALGSLANLNLNGNSGLGAAALGGGFEPLRHLGSVTSLWLYECGLTALPWQLTSLPRLAQLSLASNEGLGWDEGGWPAALAPLQHLSALTWLSMSWCSLRRLPPVLPSLAALASLDVAHNEFWEEEALAPARGLPALTRLDVRGCGLAPQCPALAGFGGGCSVLALGEYKLDEALG